jgi:hypothetical protein
LHFIHFFEIDIIINFLSVDILFVFLRLFVFFGLDMSDEGFEEIGGREEMFWMLVDTVMETVGAEVGTFVTGEG